MNHLNKSLGFNTQKTEQWCRNKKKNMKPTLSRSGISNCYEFVSTVPVCLCPRYKHHHRHDGDFFQWPRCCLPVYATCYRPVDGDFRNRQLLFLRFNVGHLHLRKPEVFLGKVDIPNLPTLPKKNIWKKKQRNKEQSGQHVL